MVGTQQGYVHNQRQGTGLATTLGQVTTDDDFARYAYGLRLEAAKKAAEKKKAKDDALAKIKAINPDFFYVHNDEVRRATDEAMALGVEAMKAGIDDPYQSTDPKAVAFQRKIMEVNEMSRVSTQIRDMHKVFQQDVQAKGSEFFDPESIAEMSSYLYGRTLTDHMKDPASPPIVRQAKPHKPVVDVASALAGELSKGVSADEGANPADVKEAVRALFSDPKTGGQNRETFAQTLSTYSQTEQDRIAREAQAAGMSAPEYFAYELTDRFLKDPKGYDLAQAQASALKSFELSEYTSGTGYVTTKGVRKEESRKAALSAALTTLEADPRAIDEWGNALGVRQADGQSFADYKRSVQVSLAEHLYNLKPKDTSKVVSMDGAKKAELSSSGELWLQHMKSGQRELAQEAANYVVNRGKVLGNMSVKQAEVVEDLVSVGVGGPNQTLQPRPALKLTVVSPLEVSATEDILRKEGANNIMVADMAQGVFTFTIPIDKLEPNDNLLLSLHDEGFRASDQPYKGAGFTSQNVELRTPAEQRKMSDKLPTPAKPKFK